MKTKGWGQVFRFTFIQTLKAKSFIVSTIVVSAILVLLVLAANFLPMLVMNDTADAVDSSADVSKISTVYYHDESGIEPKADFSSLPEPRPTFVEVSAEQYDEKIVSLKASTAAEVAVYITAPSENGNISMLLSRPESDEIIQNGECRTLLANMADVLNKSKLLSLGVSEDDIALAEGYIKQDVTIAGEAPVSEFESIIKTMLPMMTSIILFMFIFVYGQMVAQAIATEKTSKVMELLLTSIKPLAVIIGKVLAIGCVALAQIAIIGTVTGTAAAIAAPFGFLGALSSGIAGDAAADSAAISEVSSAVGEIFANFNIGSVLLFIVVFILGFLFYALVAGLAGASVSRIEDLQSAMQPMALIGVLGFYLAYFPSMSNIDGDGGSNILTLLSRYLPISSPFSLPSAILMGEMSGAEVAISIGVLAVFVALMAMLVAKIYETIILHNGDRIKLGEMLKMAGEKK